MKRSDLKVGDLVRLKSGGPKMTVSSTDGEKYVAVQWFGGNHLHENLYMNPETLFKIVRK